MKGAIGNAFILNIVITFMGIFFTLLIGSMAYSKAYKTKNYIITTIESFERQNKNKLNSANHDEFRNEVNEYLSRVGYQLASEKNSCPDMSHYKNSSDSKDKGYKIYLTNEDYDYCIYQRIYTSENTTIDMRYNYMVLVYMKLDLPVVGQFLKLPITGETKTYTDLK